jgi:hypothetical protein
MRKCRDCPSKGLDVICIWLGILAMDPQFSQFLQLNTLNTETEVKVVLRPTVSRPVCLGVRPYFWFDDRIFFLFFSLFWHSLDSWIVAPSPTRARVCSLQCSHSLVRDTQGSVIILNSHLRIPNLEGHVVVFISPRKRVSQSYSPGSGFAFRLLLHSQGYGKVILTRLHMGY